MNNSLTAASVRGLQRHVEAIGNLADWFDLAAQPESINELFAIADREKERGELVDLSQFD